MSTYTEVTNFQKQSVFAPPCKYCAFSIINESKVFIQQMSYVAMMLVPGWWHWSKMTPNARVDDFLQFIFVMSTNNGSKLLANNNRDIQVEVVSSRWEMIQKTRSVGCFFGLQRKRHWLPVYCNLTHCRMLNTERNYTRILATCTA